MRQHFQGGCRLVSQLPQFSSVLSFVQTPRGEKGSGSFEGQQPSSGRHAWPHIPQFKRSAERLTQRPLHSVNGDGQAQTQVCWFLTAPITVHGFSASLRHRHRHVAGSRTH